MEMKTVISSNLSAVGYNHETYELFIKFQDGSLYKYTGVPENIYNGLMQAASKGSYAHTFIFNAFPNHRI